jgi:hypothetical protein
VERLFLIQIISYDWNCSQYITPRFTAAEVANYIAPLKARIAELEAELAAREDELALVEKDARMPAPISSIQPSIKEQSPSASGFRS